VSFDASTDRRLNPPAGLTTLRQARIIHPVADVRAAPDPSTGIDTQLLFGALVAVLDEQEGWAFVQAEADRYCGWIAGSALGADTAPTHRVCVPRTFRYPAADMKRPIVDAISLGSLVTVVSETETRGTHYGLLADGTAMVATHLAPLGANSGGDPVAIAETLLHAPYLWGGASAFGIDCSGLVQLCHALCSMALPRDTDMQAATVGRDVDRDEIRRGDLVFWRGHVALCRGDGSIIHANGRTMSVSIEDLDDAIRRIAVLYGAPTAIRRVQ
jgi:cell wall-associated NlpC family hydrolase